MQKATRVEDLRPGDTFWLRAAFKILRLSVARVIPRGSTVEIVDGKGTRRSFRAGTEVVAQPARE